MGRFLVTGGHVLASAPVAVKSLGEAVTVLKGEKSALILTDKVEEMRGALDIGVTIEDVHACCRGDVVASVAYARVLNKEFSDAAVLEPMYLKDFVVRPIVSVT